MTGQHRGTSRIYLLARLQAEHPDLARRVEAGDLSVFGAAIQAGLTAPRFTMHGHDPDALAKAMRRNLPPDVLAAVVDRLTAPRQEAH